MLVIVGLIVLLGAAIATIEGARSNAGVAHPPTETTRARSSPLEGDRHGVPLRDHGRCGGAALDWLPAAPRHTTPDAQRSTRRSSTESATPGSNTNNEPTPSQDHRRRRIKPQRAAAEVHYKVRWSPGRQPMTTGG